MGGLLALRVSPVSQALSLLFPFLLPVARSYTTLRSAGAASRYQAPSQLPLSSSTLRDPEHGRPTPPLLQDYTLPPLSTPPCRTSY